MPKKPPQTTEVSYPNSEINGMNCMRAKSDRVERKRYNSLLV
jgi:hypothetical protein